MSQPIKIGGSFTCHKCGQYEDGSNVHICNPEILTFDGAQEEIQEINKSIMKTKLCQEGVTMLKNSIKLSGIDSPESSRKLALIEEILDDMDSYVAGLMGG